VHTAPGGGGMTDIKSMTNEELISYRDDLLEFIRKENPSDCRIFNDVHKELLRRLEEGERAVNFLDKPILRDLFWFIVLPYKFKQYKEKIKCQLAGLRIKEHKGKLKYK
jgi:hypothetical protein